jgi:nitric oxide reductase NorQ protein
MSRPELSPEVNKLYTELEALGENYLNLLVDVLAQHVNANADVNVTAKVESTGRYVARASGAQRAAYKSKTNNNIQVDVMSGEDEFVRPNGEIYYARKWGIHTDVNVLQTARNKTKEAFSGLGGAPMFALIYGAPGCGKTALVEAAFPDVYTLMGTGDTEVSDLVGGYVQTPNGGFDWVDGDLVRAAEKGGVYFIDEIGLIDPKVLSIVYGLMDGRRELVVTANPERGKVKADPNFFVIAATNPHAPGVRLSEALLSRFTVQTEMGTDWDRARQMGVPTSLVTGAQNLAKRQLAGEVMWAPQMRELLAFKNNAEVFGTEWAVANLLAAAPEMDRPVVAHVLGKVFPHEIVPAKI